MKKLYPYQKFIGEGVRDKMTPKSPEDVARSVKEMVIGKTPDERILLGARSGVVEVVEDAIKDGADIETWKGLPLAISTLKGYTDVVECLLRNGAKVESKYFNKDNGYSKEIYKLLQQYSKTNEGVKDLMTPKSEEEIRKAIVNLDPADKLLKSIQYGYFDIFREIYEEYRRQISDDKNSKSMLFQEACRSGNFEVVFFMIEEGVDIREYEDKGLRAAAERGYSKIVALLIGEGANIHCFDEDPLKGAISSRDLRTVQILLNKGAVMHPECWHLTTTDEIKNLLKSMNKSSKSGKIKKFLGFNESVRDEMTPKSEEEINKIIGDITMHELFRQGIRGYNYNKVEYALNNGADVHYDYEWALRHTMKWDRSDNMIKLLIEHGADINAAIRHEKEIFHDSETIRELEYYKKTNKIRW